MERCSSSQPYLFRPLSMRTTSGYGSCATLNEYLLSIHSLHPLEAFKLELITTLELDSCKLYNLDDLPEGYVSRSFCLSLRRLVNLKWASFRNNSLQDISKLAKYETLEELSLENNEIESLNPLISLKKLSKLDASNNLISTIDAAEDFSSLMLLSLENNLIRNLKPFSKISTLLEFCKFL